MPPRIRQIGTGTDEGGTGVFSAFMANNYTDANNAPQPDEVATGLAFTFVATAA